MAGSNNSSGLYRNTPIVDFYMDVWEPIEIASSPDDRMFTITPREAGRPDILSNDVYGTPRKWWVFMLRNKDVIFDPIDDFSEGTVIYIPARGAIDRL